MSTPHEDFEAMAEKDAAELDKPQDVLVKPAVIICHASQREQVERILGLKLEEKPHAIW